MLNKLSPDNQGGNRLIELIGWVGVSLIVLAYILISFGQLDGQQGVYQIINLLGAVGIIIHSLHRRDYQPAVLNVIWALIAVFALLSLAR
jgi:hypothetical protein